MALTRLQNEARRRGLRPGGGGEKVRPLLQSLHGTEARPASAPSRAEPLTAPRAASIDDFAAAFGRHAGAETVSALSHQLARLISPLHGFRLRFLCSSVRANAGAFGSMGQTSLADCAVGKSSAAYTGGACSRQCKSAAMALASQHHAIARNPEEGAQMAVRLRLHMEAAVTQSRYRTKMR